MILKKTISPDDLRTRTRLLEAAGEVFAEKGFRDATVREICKRAQANVAAVNYHFHDKDQLYATVLKYAHRCACEKYPPQQELAAGASAEQKLAAFIKARLCLMFDEGRPAWHGKLMAREMIEPTQALDQLVEEQLRPKSKQLEAIVRELLCKRATEQQVQLTALSVVAQCVFYHHARAVVTRLYPKMKFGPAEIETLAAHITEFSLGALRQKRRELERG